MTPKQLQRISRFQYAGNEIIYNTDPKPLVDVAYAYQYTDQTHFTKNFREYSGVTPFMFMHDSDIIKKRIHN